MKYSLSKLASIAEIFGAVAVVISLIFVGLQIRDNTRATQAATFQQHMSKEVEIIEHFTDDPEISRLYVTALNNPEDLAEEDLPRATMLLIAEMRVWEDLYMQWYGGTLSEAGWRSRETVIRNRALHPFIGDRITVAPDGAAISGVFAEYLLQVRAEAGLQP